MPGYSRIVWAQLGLETTLGDMAIRTLTAFNRDAVDKKKERFVVLCYPTSPSSSPVSVSQLAPACHERFHFLFAVASGVARAAVEVGDEVAFLVDA